MSPTLSAHPRRAPMLVIAIAMALSMIFTMSFTHKSWADDGPSQADLPVFEFAGIITNKDEMIYDPRDEYIFPSVFHAGAYLDDPLGEWYLYFAPHEDPGGIMLMYADSLDGPWTEHPDNPLIENVWEPHYGPVPHVSSPDAYWNEEAGELFMYFHGNNSTTRYATSSDGVNFEYGGVAIADADAEPGTTETSYARVFAHPDPNSEYTHAMFYMQNMRDNIRRIKVAESVDGRDWDVRDGHVVVPGPTEGQNVSSADLWEWEGQLYVIYHASSGKIHARTIDETLSETGPTWTLHEASGVAPDDGRTASPQVVTHEGETYLFYEAGDRLGGTIAYARMNPDAQRPQEPGPDTDPLRELCPGAGSDEFDADLDSGVWTTVRGDRARHEVSDGQLHIPTYPAGIAGSSFPLQDVPDGEWEVTTEVTIDPAQRFQQGGLVLYRDDDNYAKFDLTYGSNGLRVEYIWRQNGSDRNSGFDSVVPPADLEDTFWLRLTSDGENVRASASTDGEVFGAFGRDVRLDTLNASGIGPFAMRGATDAPEITASFGWFRWTPTEGERDACDVGTDPEPTEPEPTDPEPEPTDPGPTDPGPTDPGSGDGDSDGPTDPPTGGAGANGSGPGGSGADGSGVDGAGAGSDGDRDSSGGAGSDSDRDSSGGAGSDGEQSSRNDGPMPATGAAPIGLALLAGTLFIAGFAASKRRR